MKGRHWKGVEDAGERQEEYMKTIGFFLAHKVNKNTDPQKWNDWSMPHTVVI